MAELMAAERVSWWADQWANLRVEQRAEKRVAWRAEMRAGSMAEQWAALLAVP